ncbi:MAG TPA: WD40 repeat domain-containing protein [Telluria sp.]
MKLHSICPVVVAFLFVVQAGQAAEGPQKGSATIALEKIRFGEAAPFPGAFAISADASTAAHISSTGDILVWNPLKTVLLETIPADGRKPGAIALSADGQRIAIGYVDSKVALRSRRDRKVIGEFSGHRSGVTALAFSPDGRWLASGSVDGTTRLWELASGRQARLFDSKLEGMGDSGGTVVSLGFSGNGRALVVNEWYRFHYDTERGVTIWDIADGIEISTREVSPPNNGDEIRAGQAVGGSGWILAYAGSDALMVERLDQCGPARQLPSSRYADTTAVDPHGRWIAATYDQQLRFYGTTGGTGAQAIALPSSVISVVPHPDGRSVFALMTNAGNVGYFQHERDEDAASTGSPIYRIRVPQPLVAMAPLAIKADASHCGPSAAARKSQEFRVPSQPAQLKLTAQLKIATPAPLDPPRELHFSKDGLLYVLHHDYGRGRGGVVVWNPKTKAPLRARFTKGAGAVDSTLRLREGWAESSEVLRDLLTGKEILRFGPNEGSVRASDPDTGEVYRFANGHVERYAADGKRLRDLDARGEVVSLAARSGRLAALDVNGSVQVWDMQGPGQPKTYQTGVTQDGECMIEPPALSSDGRYLQVAEACGEGRTEYSLFRLGTGARFAVGPLLAPFPARSNRGVVADTRPHHLVVRDFDTGEIMARLPRHESLHTGGSYEPLVAAISDDGRLLASASYDGLVRVWDLDARQMLGNARVGAAVLSIAFDSAAQSLAVGASDGKISVFQVPARN